MLPPLANCQSERPVSARAHGHRARTGTLEDSFRPESRRLRREGAVVFCWLSLPHPASNRARHASRAMRLCSIRSFTTFAVPSILRGTSPSCPQADTSERL